jgi:hypothetical protein
MFSLTHRLTHRQLHFIVSNRGIFWLPLDAYTIRHR